IAILGLTEAVSISRSIAIMSEQRIDSNQEFIGQGLSNMAGCFFSAYASSGSFTRTGVNYNAGAKTPMSAIFSAAFLTLIIILIAPLTAYLPLASMAGILLLVAYNLIDFHHISSIVRSSRPEAAVLGVTFLATLFTQLQFAVYAGVILSLMLYLNRTTHPSFITLAPDPASPRKTLTNVNRKPLLECPQIKIFRVDGSIFFGAANHITFELDRMVKENPERAHLLLVGSGINFIDASGCQMLAQEAHRLKLSGRQLYMCSLKAEVRDAMERGGCGRSIGKENLFTTKHQAIKTLVPRLDPEICRKCTARIFNECPPQEE
ncbi:MAG: SulP family inorganic anion transporter, partial [bacterium]